MYIYGHTPRKNRNKGDNLVKKLEIMLKRPYIYIYTYVCIMYVRMLLFTIHPNITWAAKWKLTYIFVFFSYFFHYSYISARMDIRLFYTFVTYVC